MCLMILYLQALFVLLHFSIDTHKQNTGGNTPLDDINLISWQYGHSK